MNPEPIHLIVNADDFGYFRCVSRGILEAATRGVVTATGVLANSPDLEPLAAELRACTSLDAGVHLNLTTGAPLTQGMREKCARWGGSFPGKFQLVGAVLSGAVRAQDVEAEWQSQIERCLSAGLELTFLNSHEHIHMLPTLFGIATTLAARYRIPHLRFTSVERPARLAPAALLRSALVAGLQLACSRRARGASPRLLGLDPSGRLDMSYLQRTLPALRPGGFYELMCHPGRLDRREISDPRLLGYHDWEGELATLTGSALRELFARCGVSLVRYRDLAVDGRRLSLRTAGTTGGRA
jgi:chitin disaccharide deacetylase